MKTKQIESGDVFTTNEGGSVTVLQYQNSKAVTVKHNDTNGHVVVVRADHLRRGGVKNPYRPSVYGIGFMGVGEYVSKVGGKHTSAYTTWARMLERCYDSKLHARCPTYIGCSVHPDWHNFQNFAEWFERQYFATCWQLDKDLITEGNKIYSVDTCVFLPHQINSLLTDCGATRGDLPQGVTRRNCGYQAKLSINGKLHCLGTHATPEEAFEVYKLAKEENIKRMAEQYKCLIDPRVYDSLMRYEVSK